MADACEELTTLKLSTLAERLLASDMFHRSVEKQLLKRISFLEAAIEKQTKQSHGGRRKEVCKMCHVNIDFQRLEYIRDSMEHRPDLFATSFEDVKIDSD